MDRGDDDDDDDDAPQQAPDVRARQVLSTALERGWNSFGACVALAACFSSIAQPPGDAATRPDPLLGDAATRPDPLLGVLFGGVGVALVCAVHMAWALGAGLAKRWVVPPRTVGWYATVDALRAWHGASVAVAEMGLLLVLCQPLSENRGSASHIPTEHAYAPIIFAACFVAPRILAAPGQGASTAAGREGDSRPWVVTAATVALLNLGCLMALASADPCWGSLGRVLETGWSMGVFCVLCVVYAVPLPPTTTTTTTGGPGGIKKKGIAAICAVKCATLCACVALFHAREAAACGGGAGNARLHDFYRLRAIADTGGGGGTGALALGTLLRASSLCSVCLMAAHAWAATQARRAAWAGAEALENPTDASNHAANHAGTAGGREAAKRPVDAANHAANHAGTAGGKEAAKRTVDVHEIRTGVALLCIVLASFSVEAAHDYHSPTPHSSPYVADRHSTGFLLSQAVLATILAATCAIVGVRAA